MILDNNKCFKSWELINYNSILAVLKIKDGGGARGAEFKVKGQFKGKIRLFNK